MICLVQTAGTAPAAVGAVAPSCHSCGRARQTRPEQRRSSSRQQLHPMVAHASAATRRPPSSAEVIHPTEAHEMLIPSTVARTCGETPLSSANSGGRLAPLINMKTQAQATAAVIPTARTMPLLQLQCWSPRRSRATAGSRPGRSPGRPAGCASTSGHKHQGHRQLHQVR